MKKLLLTSVGIGRLSDLTKKPLSNLQLAYIPTAADPYENKWFIDEDRKKLQGLHVPYFEVDIKNKKQNSLRKELKACDAVFVSGGNSFYLLEKSLESGFDKVIKELIGKGVIYIGASAGACIAGPSLEPIQTLDEPDKALNLKSFDSFGLVDFVVLPHFGKEKYIPKYETILDKYQHKFRLVKLTNDQAIIVENNKWKVVVTN